VLPRTATTAPGRPSCPAHRGWVRGRLVICLRARCGRGDDCRCAGRRERQRRAGSRWCRPGRRPIPVPGFC